MESYIPTRASVEKQIKSFRDPTCDRLLPDLRPEMKSMGIKTLVSRAEGLSEDMGSTGGVIRVRPFEI